MANVVAPDVSDASTNTCWQKKVFFNVVNETKKHLRKMTPSSLFVYGCSNQIKYTENQGEKWERDRERGRERETEREREREREKERERERGPGSEK
jgi:hypothetical protein